MLLRVREATAHAHEMGVAMVAATDTGAFSGSATS